MRQRTVLASLILLASSAAVPQNAPERLRVREYGAIVLIFNEELSALGDRALYPICLDTPSGTPVEPLVEYLRKDDYPISDLSLCVPSPGPGESHPKDYPHGMKMFIEKVRREPGGQVDLRVETTDLTLRPGRHFARTLRRGVYHLNQNEAGTWQLSSYTKEYDSKDEKGAD